MVRHGITSADVPNGNRQRVARIGLNDAKGSGGPDGIGGPSGIVKEKSVVVSRSGAFRLEALADWGGSIKVAALDTEHPTGYRDAIAFGWCGRVLKRGIGNVHGSR